jgi:precorrin-2 dehydrogenase/sirohydrochlorin ferrochelatase/precorrin-6A/cobalt-precorrin-6A reductase
MNILVFGGASEGRTLSASLSRAGHKVALSVATYYGRDAAAGMDIEILTGRLDVKGMVELFERRDFDYAVDATHPYAVIATKNIQAACHETGLKYMRLTRPSTRRGTAANWACPDITYVSDTKAAAEIVDKSVGNALLTIGSKELEPFTRVSNYEKRVFARVLPMRESLEKALSLGFRGSNIICMQGPFDMRMNAATIQMTGAKLLVTKDSGEAGGFEAKTSAALSLGCSVVVIARPAADEGMSYDELLDFFGARGCYDMPNESEKNIAMPAPTAFFPLFIDMAGRKALVIGGGKVAERRVKALLTFNADVAVISPDCSDSIRSSSATANVRLIGRKYEPGDIEKIMPFFVIAATNDRMANHMAMEEAKTIGIPISVADCRDECTCYFPAIAESGDFIAGLASKNGDHAGVKRAAEKIRAWLNAGHG